MNCLHIFHFIMHQLIDRIKNQKVIYRKEKHGKSLTKINI